MIEYIIFANTALILILSVLIYFKDSKDVDFDKEIINLAKPSKRFLKSFSKPAEKQKPKVNDDYSGWQKENGINN